VSEHCYAVLQGPPLDFNSFTRLLPNPNGFRLIERIQPQMTRPLRSTPITGASPLLRAGPPAEPATVLTPRQRTGFSLSPARKPERAVSHPAFSRSMQKPQTGLASPPCRTPPGPSAGTRQARPGIRKTPGFDVTCFFFDTSTANRLRSPSRSPPDASCAPFPHRSPPSRHRSRSMWWFEASPRRATPKGRQSFISCTAPHQQALPTSSPLPRSGRTLRKNRWAATALRRDWTRTSSTLPCWSTARHSYRSPPLIPTNTSSRCHLSPGRGRRRRSWLA
jgi:hypothetical protein